LVLRDMPPAIVIEIEAGRCLAQTVGLILRKNLMANGRIRAINQTRGTTLCQVVEDAGGLGGQSRGLLGRDHLEPGHGMLFVRGRLEPFMWMHMFFMRFPIDIVFIDRNNAVIRISHALKPWRVSAVVFGASQALELEAGAAARSDTQIGDSIVLEPVPQPS
jgi:uncharacterized membrane protein (UPF0127 family)